ncbi:MAG: pentapeptide repeat-containing protein [Candidatus Dojkabacteria bacterium]
MRHTRESIVELIDEYGATTGLDLRGANLKGINLSGLDLRGVNLQGANLRDSNLQNVNFRWSDLRWANMEGANMKGIDLQGAKLDFVGGLSCNTIGIKVDKRLVSQLLYHLCKMDVVNCPEWDELRNDERIIALANQSHVLDRYGLPAIAAEKSP